MHPTCRKGWIHQRAQICRLCCKSYRWDWSYQRCRLSGHCLSWHWRWGEFDRGFWRLQRWVNHRFQSQRFDRFSLHLAFQAKSLWWELLSLERGIKSLRRWIRLRKYLEECAVFEFHRLRSAGSLEIQSRWSCLEPQRTEEMWWARFRSQWSPLEIERWVQIQLSRLGSCQKEEQIVAWLRVQLRVREFCFQLWSFKFLPRIFRDFLSR